MLSKQATALLFGLLWATAFLPARAQVARGYVVDALSGDSLVNVHITNLTDGTGTVNGARGYFRVLSRADDSLRFSSVGFRPLVLRSADASGLVKMVPDTVVLPGIRVLANRVNLYRDTAAQPLRLPGVPYLENPVRPRPMTVTWGRKNFSEDAPPPTMLLEVSASISGPISHFMRYEKDQQKYEREQQASVDQRGYRRVLHDEDIRTLLTTEFNLTEAQYDSLLIIFNQQQAKTMYGVKQEEAVGLLFRFFNDQLRRMP